MWYAQFVFYSVAQKTIKAEIVKCDMIGYFKDNSQSYCAITASVLFSDAISSEIGVYMALAPIAMGVGLVTKGVVSYCRRSLRARKCCICRSFRSKSFLTSCILALLLNNTVRFSFSKSERAVHVVKLTKTCRLACSVTVRIPT